jgi:hypothetical protein
MEWMLCDKLYLNPRGVKILQNECKAFSLFKNSTKL